MKILKKLKLLISLTLFLLIAVGIFKSSNLYAATRTWDGGCGADTFWSCDANWSLDIEPVAGDTVVFNNTSDNNSSIDATFAGTITTININASYDGTITMARSLTVSTSFTQASGSFTASNQTLDMDGSFTLSGGNFTASSGIMHLASSFTTNGSSTFNHNGGTVDFDSGGGLINCGAAVFNLVNFTHTGGIKTVFECPNLPLGDNPTIGSTPNADFYIVDFSTSTSLIGMGTITFAGGLNIVSLDSNHTFPNFTNLIVNGDTIFNFYSSTDVAPIENLASAHFLGDVVLTPDVDIEESGIFAAPVGTMQIDGDFIVYNALGGFTITFDGNGGTVNFGGSSSANIACHDVTNFNYVTFSHTAGTKTIANNCNLPLGVNPTTGAGGSIINSGTLSGTGILTTTGVLQLNNGFSLSGFSGLSSDDLTIDAATANFGSYTNVDINDDLVIQNNATLIAPSADTTVGGDFTVGASSTFTHNNGTVVLTGSNQSVFGSITFNNLTKVVSSASTLTMPSGSTQTVLGNLNLKGISGQALSIVSSTPGVPWLLDSQGISDICYVSVTDSNNIGSIITTYKSISNSANPNWNFSSDDCSNIDTDGDGTMDTVEDFAPNSGDANDDGTQDSQQANVASYVNPVTSEYNVLESDSSCSVVESNTITESNNTQQDSSYDYPLGLMDFTVNCGTTGTTTSIKQYYYDTQNTPSVARKYNPNTNSYSNIASTTTSQTTIDSKNVTVLAYSVTDGADLDTDNLANGIIVDPAGLALPTSDELANTGITLTQQSIAIGLVLIGSTCAVIYRKRYMYILATNSRGARR